MAASASKTLIAFLFGLALAGPVLADVGAILARVVAAHGGDAAKPTRMLEWQVREDIRITVELDPDTLLIRRSRGVLTYNNAQMEFATGYEDYQVVGGRQVAMTERHFVMGQLIGTTTLDSVEFPAVLPAPTFAPAAGGLTAAAPRSDAGT